MILGAVVAFRRLPVLSVFPFAFPLALGIAADTSSSHGRYLFPVVPFAFLLMTVGLGAVVQRLLPGSLIVPPAALASALLLWQGVYTAEMATFHGWNVENTTGMQRWFGTVAKRISRPDDVVATNDIGAIGYFSQRRVIDLVGLVSRRRSLPENLRVYRPKLVIVYVDWFKKYLRLDSAANDVYFCDADSLYRYSGWFGVELGHNTINSRDRMMLFVRHRPDEPAPSQRMLYHH